MKQFKNQVHWEKPGLKTKKREREHVCHSQKETSLGKNSKTLSCTDNADGSGYLVIAQKAST